MSDLAQPEPAQPEPSPSRPRRNWDDLPLRLARANNLLAAHLRHARHGEPNSPPHPPTRRLDSEHACQLIVINRQLDDLLAVIEDQPP